MVDRDSIELYNVTMPTKMTHFGNRFKNKVVLITGASSGIGEALARELASQGAHLVLAARRIEKLQELSHELNAQGSTSLALVCDVTQESDLNRAVQATVAQMGRLDVVIANAGFGVVGKLEKLTVADFRRQFETNVFGLLSTFYASLSELKKSKGQFVLLGSVAGYISLPGSSPYSMSKFSVRALANAMTDELRPSGIAVTLISPGFVTSEIRRVDNKGNLRAQEKDPLPTWLPMPTALAAQKIAYAIYRRKREEIITGHGKLFVLISRFFPALIRWVTSKGLSGRPEPKNQSN